MVRRRSGISRPKLRLFPGSTPRMDTRLVFSFPGPTHHQCISSSFSQTGWFAVLMVSRRSGISRPKTPAQSVTTLQTGNLLPAASADYNYPYCTAAGVFPTGFLQPPPTALRTWDTFLPQPYTSAAISPSLSSFPVSCLMRR